MSFFFVDRISISCVFHSIAVRAKLLAAEWALRPGFSKISVMFLSVYKSSTSAHLMLPAQVVTDLVVLSEQDLAVSRNRKHKISIAQPVCQACG